MARPSSFPDGIGKHHLDRASGRRLSWYRTLAVGALLLLALTGVLGGAPTDPIKVTSPAATLSVHVPHPIRNGMIVEWRIAATARRPIADAVVSIPANLWHDMTINSLVPAAAEEEYKDGAFLFHFGPLGPGEQLLFKIDGQLNPPHFQRQRGAVRLLDGERQLAAVPVDLKVVP